MTDFVSNSKLALLIAWKMQMAHRGKVLASGIGVAAGFFLTMAQIGLLMGWIETCTLMVDRAGVDLWVIGVKSPAFDYGSPIPRQRLYQVRSVSGVAEAHPLFMAWTIWSRNDGRKVNVELVGLDNSLVGGPKNMLEGELSSVLRDRMVVVDSMYLDLLGVGGLGERFEMLGRRTGVAGICEGVRTFTASPFIFTSIDDAIQYDKRYRSDEITYVLIRCEKNARVADVADRLRASLPSVEVLTTSQFKWRTADYWMIGTGIGFTVVMTAVLGGLLAVQVLASLLSGWWVLVKLRKIDPATVFQS